MSKKLEKIFEYQKFAGNPRIEKLAVEADDRYAKKPDEELTEDELGWVNAAGEGDKPINQGNRKPNGH